MKQVQNTFGRLVQTIRGIARVAEKSAPQRPVELDPQVLRHVGGGNAAQLPNKGW